ncbi:MAG: c-type cytochrome [Pseudomonadota bacterium]|jgi:mono/diheme cytochrome c family protein
MNMLKICVSVLMLLFGMTAFGAGKLDIGKIEYEQSCANCHGMDGKGKGSIAQTFQLSVPDITTMAKRNGGVFPVSRVYDLIDGREEVKAHGTREMPIWGKYYSLGAAPRYDDYPYNPEAAVRGRILALIDYLYRLQQK